MIEYKYLGWIDLALNGAFGIEYCLHKELESKPKLLNDGIQICELLEIPYFLREEYNHDAYIAQTIISTDMKKNKEVSIKAKNTKLFIQKIMAGYIPTEPEIRKHQHFFNEISDPWMAMVQRKMRKVI